MVGIAIFAVLEIRDEHPFSFLHDGQFRILKILRGPLAAV
jgi:hypothetical protein